MAASAGRMRCIDDFLVNPTASIAGAMHASDLALAESQLMMPRSLKGPNPAFALPLPSKFDFFPAYTSDEEGASPATDDSASDYSVCSAYSIAEVFEVRHVQTAHLVLLERPGKAMMVDVPKVSDAARHRYLSFKSGGARVQQWPVPQRRASLRMPMPLPARTSQDSTSSSASRGASLSSHSPASPASTAPSSVCDEADVEATERSKKRATHIDLLQAAQGLAPATPTSPISPLPPHLPRNESTSSSDSTPSMRRKRGFQFRFGVNKSHGSEDNIDRVLERIERAEEGLTLQRHPAQHKHYSNGRPKLVARGANERAPPIVLPPFPDQ